MKLTNKHKAAIKSYLRAVAASGITVLLAIVADIRPELAILAGALIAPLAKAIDPSSAKEADYGVNAKLCDQPEMSIYLAEQIRVAAKTDKRISYIIHVGKIASPLLGWKWRKYRGINSHHRHLHVSFKPNQKGEFFNIPLLGGK